MIEPQMIDFYNKQKSIPKYIDPVNTSNINQLNPVYITAKKNYELYYKRTPGTVYFSDIEKSSAGIEGWATAGPCPIT